MTSPPEHSGHGGPAGGPPPGREPRGQEPSGPGRSPGSGPGLSPGLSSSAGSGGGSGAHLGKEGDAEGRGPLSRSPRQKVVAGVCGGLGRYADVDPVIFRIVIGVLSVAGGLGMIFYGFAWLLIPLEGEEENEGRKMLSGRVDGAGLIAVLLALVGCGLFLSMLGNGGTLSFATMLTCAVVASAVWSKHRRTRPGTGRPLDARAAQAAPDAPPETKAPPVPGSPSWWRDPMVKDGNTGHYGTTYLWGPEEALRSSRRGATRSKGARRRAVRWAPAYGYGAEEAARGVSGVAGLPDLSDVPGLSDAPRGAVDVGGLVFVLALVAGGLGAGLSWHTHPLGLSLQIGFAAALAVLGLGLAVSAFLGRTGFGTIFLTVVTTLLLAGATVLPGDMTTRWTEHTWRPTTAAAVDGSYHLGSGVGTLDLTGLRVPAGETVRTSARVGGGRLEVRVPDGVALDIRAKTGVGEIRLPGDTGSRGGAVDLSPNHSVHRTFPARPAARKAPAPGRLALTLDVGLGEVEVTRAAS
ncbi:PspC domain-containing protein [Streptomyces sp. NRRL F-5126]|uniref:PspC domain-containing protein n=1 Tax=Streptomyces sp. NRRL F-5126 TaxID=1463857 RepID=UPI00099D0968|nr:PspC domain-containing protein [Streptomyces sp. NRRL F-5126]